MAKNDVDGLTNELRCVMVYDNLYRSIQEFIQEGDGYYALSVFEEHVYPNSQLIDSTAINLVKFLSTAFGMANINEAVAIAKELEKKKVKKHALKFRSRHPLYSEGSSLYQNTCLISGMIQLNIPIIPYYNGQDVLVELNPDLMIHVDKMKIEYKDQITKRK